MNVTGSQRIAWLLIITFMALMLMGCVDSLSTPIPEFSSAPGIIASPNPADTFAQATIDYGQRQLLDLSRKATEVSLSMSQAANAAALSTQEYYQRQKLDLDFQATIVSLNIAQAAATQEFITQQTKMAGEATAVAQSLAVTATHSAYLVNGTQTAQVQAILDARVLQTDQAVAALTAYPLTATPFAVTQAALLMQQYDREQQAFVDRVVVPLIPVIAALVLLLFILGIVLANRRFLPMLWPRRLRMARVKLIPAPLIIIDEVAVDHDTRFHRIIPSKLSPANPPGLPGENTVDVEIVNAVEPTVALWIAEVERQSATTEGGLSL